MKTKEEIEALALDKYPHLNKKLYSSDEQWEREQQQDAFIAGYTACQDQDRWISIDNKRPMCYKSGDWDGKKSDYILVYSRCEYFVATAYEGHIDGSYYLNFYDKNDFEINGVTHFKYIKEPI